MAALFRDRQRDSRLIFSQSPDPTERSREQEDLSQMFLRDDGMACHLAPVGLGLRWQAQELGGQSRVQHRELVRCQLAGTGTAIRQEAENVEGPRHPPLLQQHRRQHAELPLATVDGQGRCARPPGAYRDRRCGNELRSTVPVSPREGIRAPQPGLVAPYLDRGGLQHRHPRLRREERQPGNGGVLAGNRDRGGRRGQALPPAGRRNLPRSRGRAGRAGRHHQGDPGDPAYFHDAAVRL